MLNDLINDLLNNLCLINHYAFIGVNVNDAFM
jgi:hypothetical protein